MSPLRFRRRPDTVLVEAIRRGDLEALDTLYRRYAPPLQRYARSLLRYPDVADDVVQQAFLNLAKAIAAGTDVREAKGFLYRIVRNLAYDDCRRRQLDPLDEEAVSPPSESLADTLATNQWSDRLYEVIGELPERQRAAFVLAELRGLSYMEVADAIGTTPGTVGQLIRRARLTIQRRVRVPALIPPALLRRGQSSPWQTLVARGGEALAPALPLLAAFAVCLPQLPALLGLGGPDSAAGASPGAPGAQELALASPAETRRDVAGDAGGVPPETEARAPDGVEGLGGGPGGTVGQGGPGEGATPPGPGGGGGEKGPGDLGSSPGGPGRHSDPPTGGSGSGSGPEPRNGGPGGLNDLPAPAPEQQSGSQSAESPTGHSSQVSYQAGPGGAGIEQDGHFPLPGSVPASGPAGPEAPEGDPPLSFESGANDARPPAGEPMLLPELALPGPAGLVIVAPPVANPRLPNRDTPGGLVALPDADGLVSLALPVPESLIAIAPRFLCLERDELAIGVEGTRAPDGYSLGLIADASAPPVPAANQAVEAPTPLPTAAGPARVPGIEVGAALACDQDERTPGDDRAITDNVAAVVYKARIGQPIDLPGEEDPPDVSVENSSGGPGSLPDPGDPRRPKPQR